MTQTGSSGPNSADAAVRGAQPPTAAPGTKTGADPAASATPPADLLDSLLGGASPNSSAAPVSFAGGSRSAPARQLVHKLVENIEQVLLGKTKAVRQVVAGLLARGHILIQDVPGVGKTTLARALARSIATKFQRIQFTPDLLPGDLIGVSVYNQSNQKFEFHQGPIFSGILLADEINRTPPRTQSALLEAMAEYTVTTDGQTRKLPEPFMVLATQNPIEFGGTYPLPEAQLDRFLLRIDIGYPNRANEKKLLQQGRSGSEPDALKPVMTVEEVRQLQALTLQIRFEDSLIDYTLDLVEKTRTHKKLLLGASPRAALMLQRAARANALINDREFVIPEDIKAMAKPVLIHRLVARGMGATAAGDDQVDEILSEVLNAVPVPQ